MGVAFSGAGSGLPQAWYLGGANPGPQVRAQLLPALNEAHRLISAGQVSKGMDLLAVSLLAVRAREDAAAWEQLCPLVIDHPVSRLVWQDPFTEHSYRKPSGYSGDARLLDYLYGQSKAPPQTSPVGNEVFAYMMAQLGARSVRSRAQILARIIDQTAADVRAPRILSIACGHLREAALSEALNEHRVGEFLAFDQDEDSLAEVERTFGRKGVRVVQGSVRTILSEKIRFENFDLVYAAGLYDYLSDRVAARLTRMMFDMLIPGGRLVVANFAPCLPETGYMETFMAWKLIYRQPHELQALGQFISGEEWGSNRLFWDEHESIVFLDLIRRRPKLQIVRPDSGGLVMPTLPSTGPESMRATGTLHSQAGRANRNRDSRDRALDH